MRKRGRILMGIGFILIAGALSLTVYNTMQEKNAAQNTEVVLQVFEEEIEYPEPVEDPAYIPDYILNPDMEMPVKTVNGKPYIGKLSIPALNRAVPVMTEWDYDKLKIAPCHYTGTIYARNMVIMAHNYNSHFGPIKNLSEGDEVTFLDMDGNLFAYVVELVEELPATAIDEMVDGGYDLTLFTCTLGGAARVTVRCTMVDSGQYKDLRKMDKIR